MRLKIQIQFVLAAGLLLVPGIISARAQAPAADDKDKVLDRLNTAAANFHSAAADVEFDTIETDPVPDTDVQKGVVYYERKGTAFRAGVHFSQHNGRPSTKAYTYINGVLSVFDPGSNQVTNYAKAGKYESYIILGFGASGRELASKWDITYLGSEPMSDGKTTVKTQILELVAKDPEVRKNVSKVTIWVDADRAVSLKQVFILSPTSSYVGRYTNFRLNQSLPDEAFKLKTDK
jgi:outer membrane lipoprotein-sorting protein